MSNIMKLISDIFAMSFDIIIPVSGCIVAILFAIVLFSIRYFTFQHKKKKFAGQPRQHTLTPRTRPSKQENNMSDLSEADKFCDKDDALSCAASPEIVNSGEPQDSDGNHGEAAQ